MKYGGGDRNRTDVRKWITLNHYACSSCLDLTFDMPDLNLPDHKIRNLPDTEPAPEPEPEPEHLIPALSERPRNTPPARQRKKNGCCGSRPSKE